MLTDGCPPRWVETRVEQDGPSTQPPRKGRRRGPADCLPTSPRTAGGQEPRPARSPRIAPSAPRRRRRPRCRDRPAGCGTEPLHHRARDRQGDAPTRRAHGTRRGRRMSHRTTRIQRGSAPRPAAIWPSALTRCVNRPPVAPIGKAEQAAHAAQTQPPAATCARRAVARRLARFAATGMAEASNRRHQA